MIFLDSELGDSFLSEKDLVKELSFSESGDRINYSLFSNLLYDPVMPHEFESYTNFYIDFEVEREKLGFKKGKNILPGDFDILVIPAKNEEVYFDRTCVFETKVVRPTRQNPKKAPNSYGIEQMNGLINDGFPLVGIIHFCMTEPLKEQEKATIKYYADINDISIEGDNNKKHVNIKYDHFSHWSMEKQMKRLLSKDIPKYIGLNTIGVNINKREDKIITTYNQDFNRGYCSGYFNPKKKDETIKMIKSYFIENRDSMYCVK